MEALAFEISQCERALIKMFSKKEEAIADYTGQI